MTTTNQLARVALLVGEPARAAMLLALMDGRALTASELAKAARITPQTASAHLARLTEAQLLSVARQGRHRYHRLASAEVARMLEGIMQVSSGPENQPARVVTGPKDRAMREARTCYDHFAGRLGVAICDALLEQRVIEFDDEAGIVTESGIEWLREHGIAAQQGPSTVRRGRPICRPCLDWSERRPHVAGKIGAAICQHFSKQLYVQRVSGSRALAVTPSGSRALFEIFGVRGF